MIRGHHDTISITEKDFEEYYLYWHDSDGKFEDEFICRIYGHVDNAVKTAQFISNKQCEYISYPTVIKSWSEWETENER
mgnify:CR=1 FL=1